MKGKHDKDKGKGTDLGKGKPKAGHKQTDKQTNGLTDRQREKDRQAQTD